MNPFTLKRIIINGIDRMPTTMTDSPQTLTQLIASSFKVYGRIVASTLVLVLLLAILGFVPRLFALLIGQNVFVELPYLSPYRLWLLVSDIFSLLIFTALLWSAYRALIKKPVSIGEAIAKAIQKFPHVIVAVLILWAMFFIISLTATALFALMNHQQILFGHSTTGILFTSLVFLIQVGLILFFIILFYFYLPIILLENKGVIQALGYSATLVWNQWWRVFALQIFPWVCFVICLFILKYFIQLPVHIYFTAPEPLTLVSTIINLILFLIFIPWIVSILFVQFRDLEIRKNIVPKIQYE